MSRFHASDRKRRQRWEAAPAGLADDGKASSRTGANGMPDASDGNGADGTSPKSGAIEQVRDSMSIEEDGGTDEDAKDHAKGKRGERPMLRLAVTILVLATTLSALIIGIMELKTGGRLLDPIAATYGQDGTIYEDDVTTYIQAQRKALGLDGEDEWKAYLEYSETTPEKVRQGIIEMFVQRHLLDDYAKQKRVSVSDEEVDADIRNTKGALGLTDEAWEKRLSELGYDDDMYRTETYYSLLADKMTKETTTIADGNLASDALLRYISAYPLDGATDIDAIVMRKDEKDEADKIAEELSQDPSKFDEEKAKHSETTEMDGWSVTNTNAKALASLVTEVQPGGISGIVDGDAVIAIVRVNQRLENMPTDTLDGIPQDVVDGIRDMLAESGRSEKFQAEMSKRLKQAHVKVRDMPGSLPYAVTDDGLGGNENGNENENGNGNTEQMAANADVNGNGNGNGSARDDTVETNDSDSD